MNLLTPALISICLAMTLPLSGQIPNTLLHSVPAPFGVAQAGGQLGRSVAIDGGFTVVGSPYDDFGETNSGVVKVFDSTTGALLFVLPNPSPAANENFGLSVAISGTRVVVGDHLNDTGATNAGNAYVYNLSGTTPTVPVITLNNPVQAAFDNFGYSVAISGTRVVVGVYAGDSGGVSDAGSAYVYDLQSGTPTLPIAVLSRPNPAAQDYFGAAVAISGTRVVVGAHGTTTSVSDAGSAYVYDMSSGTPSVPVTTLINPSPVYLDNFGFSVAISGTQVVVGAYSDDVGTINSGSAHVYDLTSATPAVALLTLSNPSPVSADMFGSSVGVSGARVVIGAYGNDTGASSAGSAYVYDLTGGTPTVPTATLTNPTPASQDNFGYAVTVSGTRVVVGAPADDTGATDVGSAYAYDMSSSTPTVPLLVLNHPVSSADDYFGSSVAISGNLMVVGAYADDTGVQNAGSAYVFNISSGRPTVLIAALHNPSPSSGDYFGYSVAISGSRVVVGAYEDNTGGSVYVYDMSSSTPTVPVLTLQNPSPNYDDYFGRSVAISGNRVVVGAYGDDTGVYDAGSSYVYDLNSSTPSLPVVTLNNPSPAYDDKFGYAVAISGTRLVVGAHDDSTGGFFAGSAYVYELSSSTPTVPVASLHNPNSTNNDAFGYSVAVSGTRVVVGDPSNNTGASNAGSAFVYDMSTSNPTVPVLTLNNPSPATDDNFGISVAISGTNLVVSAAYDDTPAANSGNAYLYNVSSATPVVTLNNPSPAVNDCFGLSVAIDGTKIAIGSPYDDSVNMDKGYAYVFGPATFPDISVEQAATLTDGSGNVSFGSFETSSSGATLTFTIRNTGTATLSGLNVIKDGTNAADFTVSALSGTSIPVDAAAVTFTVTFSPSSVGVKTAALHITSNVTGAKYPFDINLTGNGLASSNANLSNLSLSGGITISPVFATDTLSYTAELPNTQTSITVAPVKVDPLALAQVRVNGGNYNLSNSPLALNVGINTVDVRVTAPNGSTTKTYTITVTRAVGPEIVIRGNGVEITDGDVSPSLVDDTHFGSLSLVSGAITHTFTLTNTGALALTLTGTPVVQISGSHATDFQVSVMPESLLSASSGTTFQITFDPSVSGLRTAIVSVDSDDADEAPYTFAISGVGRIGSQAAQTIAFDAPQKLYPSDSPFTLNASASSGLPVVFSMVSGPASVTGNVLTLTGAGTVKVRASQSGNTDFLAATPVERAITVSANPTTLTLTNLSQTYTGTPREITVLGATGQVDVTYKVGASYVSTAPTNAGSYPVKAVEVGVNPKTGTLVITKAPLFVTPDDQRKFAGQVNPVLGYSYSGFLASDNAANSVSKAPLIATTATATSAGGLYPITASGGTSANYYFVYLKGTMKVETFAGSYEALLVDAGSQRPSAKLELTVAASSKAFTGKLTTATETAAVALNGMLSAPTLNETVTGSATVKKGTNTYLVTFTLPLTGDFTAETKLNGTTFGGPTNGRKLLTLATGQTLSYTGTHSALLAPATSGLGVPAGAGWAVAMIDAKGLLKLAGKLADGTTLTASLAADVSSNPGYRIFLQPYTPVRTGSFIAGAFALKPQLDPGLTGRRYVAFDDVADLTWVKAPRTQDGSYRAGFGPVSTRFTLDPWLPTVPSTNLALRLGLSGPAFQFTAKHSTLSSASAAELPTTLALNATTNAVSVITPANTTKWKVSITPATGAFVGSFELSDAGKKRTVPFSGILRQPPVADTSGLIGDGNFQLPALPSATSNEVLSGEIGFER